ncbi:nli interacting factor-like phosphatase family protein [Stylonychia lemnae]|uniref:Mitochondrial import inner membrane translocase subunit TIM50 n=1 Tax=Stylonychia lemnae TaxID=5949 RepID=A0A077ZR73_STYLE|nr:nli interacting factor-like phosphatase family protein [Stylonychia lemnae]|eukprot:CDW71954.1 nli interacting factor-like phosphatase family protein [Stylonychia lemnae]
MQQNYNQRNNDDGMSNIQEETVPEEIISPTQSMKEKMRFQAITKYGRVEEKLKKYDTGSIIEQKQSNPLLKNKGYIADDWKWEQSLKKEIEMMKFQKDRARNKTFNTGQLSEIQKNINGKQMNPPGGHRDSGKNTVLSCFNLNQSTNHAGPQSNNINIRDMQSHNKDSNNRLTFKTINDNTWDASSKQEVQVRNSLLTNEHSPQNRFKSILFLIFTNLDSNQFIRSSLDNEEQKQIRPSPEQQTYRDKLQPRNKLSSMKGLRYKNLQSLDAQYKDEIQKYAAPLTGQIFCDNLIQEIQENSEELQSSVNDSQFKKSQTAYVSKRDLDTLIVKKPYQRMRSEAVLTVKIKKTIVFDLDETLVRAQEQVPEFGYDQKILVIDENYFWYVKWRPGLLDALNELSQHFELILFTAANFAYADRVLQTFEGHQFFSHILVRDQCLFVDRQKVFIKDLQILTNGRSLKDIIIVDNKIESYSSNLENGIPIKSYYGELDDDRLPHLVQHLMKLKDVRDVRTQILKDFFLKEVTDKQRQNDDIFDSARIKQCVLNDKEKYQQQKELDRRKFSRSKNNQIIEIGRFL